MGDVNSKNPILWFFLACFLGSIILMGWLIKPFLPILVLAGVVSGMFYRVYTIIHTPSKIGPSVASLVTCLLIFCILFIPIVFFVSSLAQQAFNLYLMAKGAVISDQINDFFRDTRILDKANEVLANFNITLTGEELKTAATDVIRFVAFYLYEQSRSIATNLLTFVVNFFLMLMVIYYLLIDGKRLLSFIVELSPLPSEQESYLFGKFRDMAGAVLIGNGLGGIIQGGTGGILFAVFGFESAFVWGVIMGILAFLPIIGIGVILVPTSIYMFIKGRIAVSLVFLIFYLVLMTVTEYLFKPKIVGKRVKMHPLIVFFAIIGGLKLFGILGIIYGPIIITAFLTLAEIYRSSYQQLVEKEDGQSLSGSRPDTKEQNRINQTPGSG
ncbi:MAG: AI-2E family transporter [Desulfobacteraceae bacterium]|nr:AI-2E family transporter [Desulfobacteraceae bacterium]